MAFISHIKAAFSEQRFALMGAERQTNIHAHVLENKLSKPDMHPPTASRRLAVGAHLV